jgi:hypothetical protein
VRFRFVFDCCVFAAFELLCVSVHWHTQTSTSNDGKKVFLTVSSKTEAIALTKLHSVNFSGQKALSLPHPFFLFLLFICN